MVECQRKYHNCLGKADCIIDKKYVCHNCLEHGEHKLVKKIMSE